MNIKSVRTKARKGIKALGRITQLQPKLKYYYGYFYRFAKVKENTILFESFHGRTISDSSLYLLREFLKTEESKSFKIYYATANPEAHGKFIAEHNLPVELVNIMSRKYPYVLATCQYLVNNSSFPAYFIRRKGQRYLQTWHGTPLKTLGKRMRLGIESMYNVQHNFIQASHLIFPNEFTRHVMMRDYNLEDLYTGKVAMCGYPRNSIFFQSEKEAQVRQRYQLEGLECIAYMPTWRGTSNHDIQIDGYKRDILARFDQLDAQLKDNQRIFVNFHPLVASDISLEGYEHILPFPADADNYEFLNAMDALITDYSSVFFDFSATRKPILLWIYDVEEYMHDRGTYLDIESLPFQKAYDTESLGQLLSSGAYRNCSYANTDYEREFLEYETADNCSKALDFLFGRKNENLDIINYAPNRKRTWQVVRVAKQSTIEQIDTICRSIRPEKQIAVFYRHAFTQEKSAFLHDNYRDAFNFVFITKTTPRTLLEEFRAGRNKRVAERVENRERRRVFGDLTLGKVFESTFVWAAGTSVQLGKCITTPCEAWVQDNRLNIRYQDSDHRPTHLIVTNKDKIVWARPLTPAEAASRHIQDDFTQAMADNDFKAKTWLRVGVGQHDIKTKRLSAAFFCNSSGKTEQYIGPLPKKREELNRNRDESQAVEELLPFACFHGKANHLVLYITSEGNELSGITKGHLVSVKVRHGSSLVVKANYGGTYSLMGMELVYRSKTEHLSFPLPCSITGSGDSIRTVTATIDVPNLPLKEIYWDLYLVVDLNGSPQHVPVVMRRLQTAKLVLGNIQAKDSNDCILFPYVSGGKRIAFTYRGITSTDTMAFKLKELAALATFFLLHPYWSRKRVWLVYEKFCSNAQDNGFYFFQYCMTQLPREKSKHVYFIIDRDSKDLDNLKPFMSNVIYRFSFKHLLYCLVGKIYIASDSKSHLYVWRPKTNLISKKIRHHKIFFLQHGVTALKRVDNIFGKHGSSPMTYFLTTSRNEQDIVVKNFGYQPEFAPILGFSRWDLLEDLSD